MDYQIALSPDLNLSSDDFAAAWNDTSECRDVAEAQSAKATNVLLYHTNIDGFL